MSKAPEKEYQHVFKMISSIKKIKSDDQAKRSILDCVKKYKDDSQYINSVIGWLADALFIGEVSYDLKQRVMSILLDLASLYGNTFRAWNDQVVDIAFSFLDSQSPLLVLTVLQLLNVISKFNPVVQERVCFDEQYKVMDKLFLLSNSGENKLLCKVFNLLESASFGNPKTQAMIGESQIIQQVINQISTQDEEVRLSVLNLIGSLCQLHAPNRKVLGVSQGIVLSHLLNIVNNVSNTKLCSLSLRAIANISIKEADNQNAVLIGGGIKKAVSCLESSDVALLKQAVRVLSIMCSSKDFIDSFVALDGVNKVLSVLDRYHQVGAVLDESVRLDVKDVLRSTLRILLAYFEFSLRSDDFQWNLRHLTVIVGLMTIEDVHVQEKAVKLLGWITLKNAALSLDLIKLSETISSLKNLLLSGSIRVCKEAVLTIRYLFQHNKTTRNSFKEASILPDLLTLLKDSDQVLRSLVWQAMQSCVLGDKERENEVFSDNNLNSLMRSLESSQEPSNIEGVRFLRAIVADNKERINKVVSPHLMDLLFKFIREGKGILLSLECFQLLHAMLFCEDHRTLFQVQGGVELIASCLKKDSLEVREWALKNISRACDHHLQNPHFFRDARVIPSIFTCLQDDYPDSVKESALSSLNFLVWGNSDNAKLIKKDKELKSILMCTNPKNSLSVVCCAIELLSYLTDKDERVSKAIRRLGFWEQIQGLLSQDDLGIQQYTVRTIGSVFQFDPIAKDSLIDLDGGVTVLMKLFDMLLNKTVCTVVLATLAELTYKHESSQTFFMEGKRVARFIQLLHDRPEYRFYAKAILRNINYDFEERELRQKELAGVNSLHRFSFIASSELSYDAESQVLGEGSFARVFLGSWGHTPVAIKMLKFQGLRSDKELFDELLFEAALAMSLRHLNIATVLGVCADEGRLSIVVEYLAHGSLFNRIHKSGDDLPWIWRYRVSKGIAEAVAFLHSRDVVHRDIKSANVLLDDRDTPKLTDFGLSRVTSSIENTLSQAGVVGSLLWSPPELRGVDGGLSYTAAVDVYSVAMVFYELASRMLPWQEEMEADGVRGKIMRQLSIMQHSRPKIPENTPQKYVALIQSCWKKEAGDRPAASSVVESLQEILSEEARGPAAV